MANTYTFIYIQVVFAVKHRQALINPEWEVDLYKYIRGIASGKEQSIVAINGMPDHIHILLRIQPTCRLSDLVREIKKSSTAFIKEKKYTKFPFHWQEGYGAFSYSRWDVDKITNYIATQKEHHRKKNFQTEYREFLKMFEVEFKEEYLFDWIQD